MKNFIDSPRNMLWKLPYLGFSIIVGCIAYSFYYITTVSEVAVITAFAQIGYTLCIMAIVASIVYIVIKTNPKSKQGAK